ncbi:MAG: lysylphosphatidylglycerol synthase transmembrane domain-containing protein [Pirellulales bacterium]
MNLKPANLKRRLMTTAKLVVVTLVVWWVWQTLRVALDEIEKTPRQIEPAWLVLSGVLYALGLLPCGIFWHRILVALGQEARLLETLRAYYIGHLGKYVPGKAMVIVLRAGLVRSHRVDAGVAAVSVFFETMTMMAVGAFVAAAVLAAWFRHQGVLVAVAVLLMAAAGLPTFPPIFKRLVRLVGVGRSNPEVAQRLDRLRIRDLVAGWMGIALGWCLMGLSLWATLRAMGMAELGPLEELPRLTATTTLAVVAGIVSLIPGGAGVRELVLTELMKPRFGLATALLSAVVLRLVWLVTELAISTILYGMGPRRLGTESPPCCPP